LGDLICLVPALRALRSALPTAEVTLIGLPGAKSFVQRFAGYLDRWLEFPGYPGIPEVPLLPQRVVSFLATAQTMQFDLALQMHGNGSWINGFTLLLGAKLSAGFFPADYSCPDRDHFLPYPEQESEIWRHLRLLEFLGVPLQGDRLEFPLWQSDWLEFRALAQAQNLQTGKYICIHSGASVDERRWTAQHFAIVADALAAQDWQIVLTGTVAEQPITQAVTAAMQFPAIDLTGQTSLGGLAALLKNAQLLICNDTGVSHLAAALQVKSVVIFTHSDPQRWAPLDRQRHRIAINSPRADEQVSSIDAVLAEAIHLLQREGAYVV
jgi:ADP-heptose:LPS heptosyltransferase